MYLQGELSALGVPATVQKYGTGSNVYGILKASTPSTANIIVGAHFDTVPGSPGANDNATGVALVMAVARYLVSVDCRQSNVYFVFFDEEEVGLVGSGKFAAFLNESAASVTSVHTIDQVGWDKDGDRAIELERPSGDLYADWVASRDAAGLTMPLHLVSTGSTDHVSFRANGFSAIGITEEYVNGDTSPNYHKATDAYDSVNFAYLRSATVLANSHFARLVRVPPARATMGFTRLSPANRAPRKAGCRHAYEP